VFHLIGARFETGRAPFRCGEGGVNVHRGAHRARYLRAHPALQVRGVARPFALHVREPVELAPPAEDGDDADLRLRHRAEHPHVVALQVAFERQT
jgi:hypothetical protein